MPQQNLCFTSILILSLFFFKLFWFLKVLVPTAVGLESGFIGDSDLSAQSSKTGHEPWRARLHGPSCWMPEHDDKNQFFTVYLRDKINLTAVATQGGAYEACWITAYILEVLHATWYKYMEDNVEKVSLVYEAI